jgi:hypothetical protein
MPVMVDQVSLRRAFQRGLIPTLAPHTSAAGGCVSSARNR